jgi:hypothetical protein
MPKKKQSETPAMPDTARTVARMVAETLNRPMGLYRPPPEKKATKKGKTRGKK